MSKATTALFVMGMMLGTACSQAGYVPSKTPLAKLVNKGSMTSLSVGERQVDISPFNDRYVDLLREPARGTAQASHRHRRSAFWLNLPAAAAGIAVLVLAVSDWNATSDIDTPTGKAALSLTVGSALIGAFSGRLASQAQSELHEAVAIHNDVVYGEATAGEVALEPPAVSSEAPSASMP
jgi:hypothetical protein